MNYTCRHRKNLSRHEIAKHSDVIFKKPLCDSSHSSSSSSASTQNRLEIDVRAHVAPSFSQHQERHQFSPMSPSMSDSPSSEESYLSNDNCRRVSLLTTSNNSHQAQSAMWAKNVSSKLLNNETADFNGFQEESERMRRMELVEESVSSDQHIRTSTSSFQHDSDKNRKKWTILGIVPHHPQSSQSISFSPYPPSSVRRSISAGTGENHRSSITAPGYNSGGTVQRQSFSSDPHRHPQQQGSHYASPSNYAPPSYIEASRPGSNIKQHILEIGEVKSAPASRKSSSPNPFSMESLLKE